MALNQMYNINRNPTWKSRVRVTSEKDTLVANIQSDMVFISSFVNMSEKLQSLSSTLVYILPNKQLKAPLVPMQLFKNLAPNASNG